MAKELISKCDRKQSMEGASRRITSTRRSEGNFELLEEPEPRSEARKSGKRKGEKNSKLPPGVGRLLGIRCGKGNDATN